MFDFLSSAGLELLRIRSVSVLLRVRRDLAELLMWIEWRRQDRAARTIDNLRIVSAISMEVNKMNRRILVPIAYMLLLIALTVGVELAQAAQCDITCPGGGCEAAGDAPCTCQCVGNLGEPSCSCGSSGGGKIVPHQS